MTPEKQMEKSPHGGDIYRKERITLDASVSVNPFPLPRAFKAAMRKCVDRVSRYPDLNQTEFRRAVARIEGLKPEYIIGGSGASELIMAVVRALAPKKILTAIPCFSGYRRAALVAGVEQIVEYPLKEESNFELDFGFLDAITPDVDAVFLEDPNNPTGKSILPDLEAAIIDRCDDLSVPLILDESFLQLGKKNASAAILSSRSPNLYVVNSFTKTYAIPGLRVGYLVSNPENVERVKQNLPEWNMSLFAQEVGALCANELNRASYVRKARNAIYEEAPRFENELRKLGLKVVSTDTNFILFYTPEEGLCEHMLSRGILIRDCANFRGLRQGWFRVAVRTPKENQRIIRELQIWKKQRDEMREITQARESTDTTE